MSSFAILILLLQASGGFQGESPFAVAGGSGAWTKRPGVGGAAGNGGSYLGGADDCNTPHVFVGTGPVSGVPFTTGTTGTTGQNEGNCYFFGSTGIDGDVWFDWRADFDGNAELRTCNGTVVDTKVAVWPDHGPSSCPSDGASLACNDDSCGLQSAVQWPIAVGSTYTIQLGTFPGASGGSGTFEVLAAPPFPPCGQYDEMNGPTAFGLTTGGEMGWMHHFDCMQTVHTVSTGYGDILFPGSMSNGGHSWILVYEDGSCDLDATTDLTLRASIDTVVTNANTELLNDHPIGPITVPECFWIAATADHPAGEFPGPMELPSTPAAWVVGSTLGPGTLDIFDLNNNNVPPLQMIAAGFPCSWLLRAEGETGPGAAYCSGDGSGTPCPCANAGDPDAGCGNGSFPEGALMLGSGAAAPDTVTLVVSRLPSSQPGLFFQGDNAVNGGAGIAFGDGLRCAGTNVVRLETTVSDAGGFATSSVPLSTTGGAVPGDTRHYQYWYRDPLLSPCGQLFNLTNGYRITW